MAIHLTGRYPEWWNGRRFNHAIKAMAGSESAELTRKGVQRLLLGPPEIESLWGTGMLPADSIVSWSRKQGVPNTIDNIVVRNIFGGVSILQFASYDQGRSKWQADTIHVIWFDEEPKDPSVYLEGITRTNATDGYSYITFTPLRGASTVVQRFYPEPQFPSCGYVKMGISDAKHFTPEQVDKIIAKYPKHEREARANGTPILGSGAVFPIIEDEIVCSPFPIPKHWARICGLDFGYAHPSAACWLAWDKDTDIVYLYDVHCKAEAVVAIHADAIKARGAWIPVAWPKDGDNQTAVGPQLSQQYRDKGVNMLPIHAQFPQISKQSDDNTPVSRVSVGAGIQEMIDRMMTGRWKVFAHCEDWLREFRMYHLENGIIVKEMDDCLDASRYAMMMLRFAEVQKATHANWRERLTSGRRLSVGYGGGGSGSAQSA